MNSWISHQSAMAFVLSALVLLHFAAAPVLSADALEDKEAETPKWDVSSPNYSVEPQSAKIDVDQGTWMSLDVSPDGKQIAFDLLGDIYRIPFEGGKAEALLSGHAWEIQPRFSPDGTSIAFTSDRAGGDNIWVMALDSGDVKQVTHENFRLLNNPSWSPDGDYLAARKHFTTSRSLGSGEIWLFHVNGSEGATGVQVVELPDPTFQKELGEPTYAPDGKTIYYSQNSTPGNTFIYRQDSNKEVFQIRKVNLETGEKLKVVGGPGGAVRPTPSPDGQYLAYIKRVRATSRLFMMDLNTGEETMLVDQMDLDLQETWAVQGVYPNMDWTPDSQQIVYWADGRIWRIDIDTRKISNIPFQVTDTRVVYPVPRFPIEVAPASFDTRMVRFARHSPDNKSVVFESLGKLYIKQGNRVPVRLTGDDNGFELYPAWSPKSDKIYFIRWNDQELATIRSISVRGGTRTKAPSKQLNVERGQYAELSLSADGETLAYRKLAGHPLRNPQWGQEPGIYLLDVKTRKASFVSRRGVSPQLTQGKVFVLERKSPSGRGSDTSKTKLLSMTRDGLDIREISDSEFATDIKLSPDRKHIAFLENFHVHVSTFPRTGKSISVGPTQKSLPTQRVSKIGGAYMNWSADSSRLSWSVGPELKTVLVNDILFSEKQAEKTDDEADTATSINLSQTIATDLPKGQLALTGARIITMNEDRRVIENGTMLISGNRITAIGAMSEIQIPDSATTVELQGKTIVPGFIDAHAHGPYASGDIIPQQNWSALAHLALGVTTVHDPSSPATSVFAASEYARAGEILAPRIYSTGNIVYGAKSTSWSPVDSLDDALSHIRRLKAQGAVSIKNYNQPRRDQRQQVIEAARLEGIMTVAEGGSLFQLDMNLIADGITGIEHNVPTLKMYDDVTQLWQQTTAAYTPTLVVTYGGLTSEDYFYQHTEVWKHPILANFVPPTILQPRSVRRPMAPESDYRDDDSAAAARVLLEAGVLVNTGAHGQREGLGTHWEMWSFVRGGMSPMQALSAATINPAINLGMAADIGSLEPGKLADMVIINANPLEDIRNTDQLSHVVLNGRVYQADTLKEVTTGNKTLNPFWWQTTTQGSIR
ncbi:MAG: amidohydrolase family protein [bacterium]